MGSGLQPCSLVLFHTMFSCKYHVIQHISCGVVVSAHSYILGFSLGWWRQHPTISLTLYHVDWSVERINCGILIVTIGHVLTIDSEGKETGMSNGSISCSSNLIFYHPSFLPCFCLLVCLWSTQQRLSWTWLIYEGSSSLLELSSPTFDCWIWKAVFLVQILHVLVGLLWHIQNFNDNSVVQNGIFVSHSQLTLKQTSGKHTESTNKIQIPGKQCTTFKSTTGAIQGFRITRVSHVQNFCNTP